MAELVFSQTTENPSKPAQPQIGHFAMERGLGGSGIVVGVPTLFVLGRAERIENDGQSEDDERKNDPVKDDNC